MTQEMTMEISEAINVLARTGRGDEIGAHIERTVLSTRQSYRAVMDDDSRSGSYKKDELDRLKDIALSGLRERLTPLAEDAVQSERRDYTQVFGIEGIPGETASLTISRRDAADRASSIIESDELRKMLDRATRSGDEVLARAVAERALENRDVDTLNVFLAERPSLEPAAERLWKARSRKPSARSQMQFTVALSELNPPQVVGA